MPPYPRGVGGFEWDQGPIPAARSCRLESFKGVVQLSGFVDSKAMMARVVEVTRSVAGVKGMKDDMRVH